MPTNTQILLDHRPTDKVSPANFRIIEAPVPAPGPGEVLVRHSFLSLDPYMRGRLSDAKSYAKPQEVGAVMGG
jgi:NADPH-dependent curcumin reductase CurA